jgi:hypothetical protein
VVVVDIHTAHVEAQSTNARGVVDNGKEIASNGKCPSKFECYILVPHLRPFKVKSLWCKVLHICRRRSVYEPRHDVPGDAADSEYDALASPTNEPGIVNIPILSTIIPAPRLRADICTKGGAPCVVIRTSPLKCMKIEDM